MIVPYGRALGSPRLPCYKAVLNIEFADRDDFISMQQKSSRTAWFRGWAPSLLALSLSATLAGCGGGSSLSSSVSSSVGGLTDRFTQLFGSKSQAVGEKAPEKDPDAGPDEPTCPQVSIRIGASTYAVGLPGKEATGPDLRYQASIIRTARDCTLSGGQVRARVGIQGRIIVGQAGAPPSAIIPMRLALVQEGVSSKVILTKAFQTSVNINPDSVTDFSLVAEDINYPPPVGDAGDSYVFYVGFDPTALKPEPKPRAAKKRH